MLASIFSQLPAVSARQSDARLPPGVTVDFSISGELTAPLSSGTHLVLERILLIGGDSLQPEPGPQIIANESGTLETVDDLGLTATLKEGEQYFSLDGSGVSLTATEPTSLLRLRLVDGGSANQLRGFMQSTTSDIVIDGANCGPASVTLGTDGLLVVENATNESQVFEIRDLGVNLRLQPKVRRTIDLSDAPDGTWTATCSSTVPGAPEVTPTTIVVGTGITAPTTVPATHTPSPTPTAPPAPSPTPQSISKSSSTLLFDLTLANSALPPRSLMVVKYTLAGSVSFGPYLFPGQSAVYSDAQPLTIARPGYLTSTLPAGQATLLPEDSVAEIGNRGTEATALYVVSLSDVSNEPAPENPVPDSPGDDSRPPYREPVASTPTPVISAREDQPATTGDIDLESFIPDPIAAANAGFHYLYTLPAASIDDTVFYVLSDYPGSPEWTAGIGASYVDSSRGELTAGIFVDRFASKRDAEEIMSIVRIGSLTTSNAEAVDAPASPNFEGVVAAAFTLPESDTQGTEVWGQYGEIIVTLVVVGPSGEDTLGPMYDLWTLIDATLEPGASD
jgi:hypothetical protein